MKNNIKQNLLTLLIVIVIVIAVNQVNQLPWWSYLFPVILAGSLLTYLKWSFSAFWIGFLAGFLIWSGANIFFSSTYEGDIISKLAVILFMSKIIVIICSGILGGALTGLALYTGKALFTNEKVAEFYYKN